MKDVSVYPRQDSPCWWIAYWCPKKLRRVAKSSGHRRDDPMGHKRALADARSLSHDASAGRSEATVARWECWVEPWLQSKFAAARHAKSLTAELNRWHWLQLYLEEHAIRVPSSLTYQHGLDYLPWRKAQKKRSGKHPSHNTALQELLGLSRIMREAVRRGFVTASPLERMGLREDDAAEKPEIKDDEIALIRAALAKREAHLPIRERWMTISFEIALVQGCRLSETSIPMERIDEKRGTLTLVQKGNRMFTTRLHSALRPLIAELRAAGATVTCTLPRMAAKEWHWLFKGRKEKDRDVPGIAPHLTFHCTRVTVITRMARGGVPISQAMAYVGHADSTIHRIYQRLQAPDLGAAEAALAGLGRVG